MINEISSKDEYIRQQWLFDQEKTVDQKKNLHKFLNDLKSIPDQRKIQSNSSSITISLSFSLFHKQFFNYNHF
jgi:hypothetical protein